VRSALAVGVLATALLTTSCGEARERAATSDSGPAPKLEGAHIRGPIPGEQVDGTYRDEKGRAVDDVHRLLVIGNGEHRAVLLLGRRGDRPCVAAVAAEKAEDAPLDCLESFENPPLVIRLVVGGETPRQTGWLAVLGIARAPTARVELDRQTAPLRAPLTTRSWPGFEWWGFGAMTERGNLGNQFGAFDAGGEPVISLDLGFSYNPPCLRSDEDVCGPKTPDKTWAESRDPVGALSGTGKEDFGTAFAHPAVRRLLAGHRFFVDGAILWQRCNGSTLGSIVSLRIWPPADFRGEIPILGDTKEGDDVSYREGLAYVEAERIAAVWVSVDQARNRVVGIDLDAFDESESDHERPKVRITKREILKEPVPAGGPDDSSQCPKDEPGE
jgi:hypothetical protein